MIRTRAHLMHLEDRGIEMQHTATQHVHMLYISKNVLGLQASGLETIMKTLLGALAKMESKITEIDRH